MVNIKTRPTPTPTPTPASKPLNRQGNALPESYVTGRRGELAAKAYLETRGYTVLAMNYHAGHREIDLIAQTADRLVFVEVKTRAQNGLVLPQDAVHRLKQYHLLRAANTYILRTNNPLEARFDIICVRKTTGGQIEVTDHIVDAFRQA